MYHKAVNDAPYSFFYANMNSEDVNNMFYVRFETACKIEINSYYRMLKMFQERIYEEPVRFFGGDGRSPSSGRSCDDIPKQIQEYRKQRLQQLVDCECGETF